MSAAIATPSQTCAALAEQLLQQHQGGIPIEEVIIGKPEDHRRSPRRNFACWQLVAEYDGVTLPAQEDFQLRLCQDISPGGVSFLSNVRPQSEDLIIALGQIPFIFFHVNFAHAVRRRDLEGHPLQIGCRFIKRLMG
ncbi:MAG: hypothetical protein ACR2FY_13070 [Pirellulaceae bacterium]